jgi:hypothetical protein
MRVKLMTGLFEACPRITREEAGIFITGEESTILVRTNNHAIAAAHAFVLVDRNYAVVALLGSSCRAYLDAWCVFTLVAAHGIG